MRAAFGIPAFVVLTGAVYAQAGLTGRLLEKVACATDASQTYALYVPSNYTAEKKWPVIFCFDPGARGQVPVERLQSAAEKFGYIVAGSQNSRNGPWASNVKAIEAMARDVESRLAVDLNRVYSAGLSGGARVATQLAMAGWSKGVIACSAGFPASNDIPGTVAFPFFGTAGSEDFNYAELKRLDGELTDRRAAHRIVIFAGGHEWASADLLAEGVEWLEIQAMRSGARAKDEVSIQTSLNKRLARLESKATGETWAEMKSIAADFKGLVDTAEYERKTKAMAALPEVKEWQKSERALAKKEDGLVSKLNDLAAGGSTIEIRKTAAELRKQAEAPEDTAERRMVRRAIGGVMISGRESLRTLFEQEAYGNATSLLELMAALRPGQSRTLFDLARACAFNGEKKRAIEALREAASVGFSDAVRAEADPAFVRLKKETAFQDALAAMRANPPETERPFRGGL